MYFYILLCFKILYIHINFKCAYLSAEKFNLFILEKQSHGGTGSIYKDLHQNITMVKNWKPLKLIGNWLNKLGYKNSMQQLKRMK